MSTDRDASRPVQQLRDAIFAYAKGDVSSEDWTPEACRAVFAEAGIGLTPIQLTAAAKTFRQLPFHGGNFTLDAKRLLKAVEEAGR